MTSGREKSNQDKTAKVFQRMGVSLLDRCELVLLHRREVSTWMACVECSISKHVGPFGVHGRPERNPHGSHFSMLFLEVVI